MLLWKKTDRQKQLQALRKGPQAYLQIGPLTDIRAIAADIYKCACKNALKSPILCQKKGNYDILMKTVIILGP